MSARSGSESCAHGQCEQLSGLARRVRSGSPKGLPVSLQLPPRQRADRVSCTGRRSIAQPYKSRYVPTAPSPPRLGRGTRLVNWYLLFEGRHHLTLQRLPVRLPMVGVLLCMWLALLNGVVPVEQPRAPPRLFKAIVYLPISAMLMHLLLLVLNDFGAHRMKLLSRQRRRTRLLIVGGGSALVVARLLYVTLLESDSTEYTLRIIQGSLFWLSHVFGLDMLGYGLGWLLFAAFCAPPRTALTPSRPADRQSIHQQLTSGQHLHICYSRARPHALLRSLVRLRRLLPVQLLRPLARAAAPLPPPPRPDAVHGHGLQ